jgi:pyridoxine 4-dehydrogenase
MPDRILTSHAGPGGPLRAVFERTSHSPSQLALAWLLRRSPVMLLIPGTSSVAHLEENLAAADVTLTDDDFKELSAAAGSSHSSQPRHSSRR